MRRRATNLPRSRWRGSDRCMQRRRGNGGQDHEDLADPVVPGPCRRPCPAWRAPAARPPGRQPGSGGPAGVAPVWAWTAQDQGLRAVPRPTVLRTRRLQEARQGPRRPRCTLTASRRPGVRTPTCAAASVSLARLFTAASNVSRTRMLSRHDDASCHQSPRRRSQWACSMC